MRIATTFIALLLSASVSTAQDIESSASNAAASRHLAMVIDSVRSQKVQRVEIVEIPAELLTRVRVTPDALQRDYYYKLAIRDIRRTRYQQPLAAVLASVSATSGGEMPDIRWGISFFDEADKRIGSLYFDAMGIRGAIDSEPVEFNGDLLKWLRQNFLAAFK